MNCECSENKKRKPMRMQTCSLTNRKAETLTPIIFTCSGLLFQKPKMSASFKMINGIILNSIRTGLKGKCMWKRARPDSWRDLIRETNTGSWQNTQGNDWNKLMSSVWISKKDWRTGKNTVWILKVLNKNLKKGIKVIIEWNILA